VHPRALPPKSVNAQSEPALSVPGDAPSTNCVRVDGRATEARRPPGIVNSPTAHGSGSFGGRSRHPTDLRHTPA